MKMNDAIKYIHEHATDVLEPDGQSKNSSTPKGYVCPICNSGSGAKGTGITTKDGGTHFTCWAGCFKNSDIIDILAKRDGYEHESNITKLRHACKAFNIELDDVRSVQTKHAPLDWDCNPIYEAVQTEPDTPEQPQTDGQKTPSLKGDNTRKAGPVNYSEKIKEWHSHLNECDYLTKRGIDPALQDFFQIGFCKTYKNGRAAIIIPTGKNTYKARFLDDKEPKCDIAKGAQNEIFNAQALEQNERPVFVVEGEIDALSFMELGFNNVVGLGSTSNKDKLVEALKKIGPDNRPALILALDNDGPGTTATLDLEKQLQSENIKYFLPKSSEIYGTHKDANECLVSEREAFKGRVEPLNKTPGELYNETSTKTALASFLEDYEGGNNSAAIKTGFPNLDQCLDGGLYAGLYVIGAISSLGKTTITLQMADNIAKAGHDVIIFSLEMAKKELIAKSISRLTFKNMRPGEETNKIACSTRDLLSTNGKKLASKERKNKVREAVQEYGEYAGNIFIIEGLGDVNIDRIKNTIAQHVIYRKKTPVVIIDYLQIIAPYEPKATDKQNTDKAVLELKRISRDYNTPVFAISSFNRDNYKETVNMASFKESGAIEYSSDVLLGLQLKGLEGLIESMGSSKGGAKILNEEINKLKSKLPREIELKVLKNRNGNVNGKVYFDYYPMYNCFEEM